MLLYSTSVLLLILSARTAEACNKGSMRLNETGYVDLTVAITNKVKEQPEMVDDIKTLIRSASQFLYNITE